MYGFSNRVGVLVDAGLAMNFPACSAAQDHSHYWSGRGSVASSLYAAAGLRKSTAWVFLVGLAIILSFASSGASSTVERTLAMIKPDGIRANHTDAIKGIIQAEGFRIVAEKEALFNESAAQSFYKEHSERSFFPQLVDFMTSGPVLALVLEKQNAIKDWRALMGPTDSNKARREAPNSVRSKFGLDGQSNCVHGSDSSDAAAREIASFFGVITQEDGYEPKISTHDEL